MADDSIIASDEWRKVRRAHRAARFSPTVSVRRNGDMVVSADFVRMAGIADCTRVSLFLSADGFRLALKFHSDERDDDAFVLSRDGGARHANDRGLNRLITAKSLIEQSAQVSALRREDDRLRRFEPVKRDGMWVIQLAPCFESTLGQRGEIASSATGIYRYRLGDDVVYIGRGNLRTRMAQPERTQWAFDRVEYSVLNDDAAERRWEAFWLDAYREKVGSWPRYNRIAARAAGQLTG